MGIVYGLAAALFWGTGDFFINRLTLLAGTIRSLILTQIFSLIIWIVVVCLTRTGVATPELWGMAILSGCFHVIGLALTYRAFEIGTLSIVSPLASSFAVVTALLELVSGERTPALALLGTGCVVLGIIVVTRFSSSDGPTSLRGVPEAIGSALAFGIMFWLISGVETKMGVAWPLMILKTMALLSALGAFLLSRKKTTDEPTTFKWRPELGLAFSIGALDTLAWAAWIFGTHFSFKTVVTALASAFSAVTVIMAAFLLKERLRVQQYGGIALLLAGIVLVSV